MKGLVRLTVVALAAWLAVCGTVFAPPPRRASSAPGDLGEPPAPSRDTARPATTRPEARPPEHARPLLPELRPAEVERRIIKFIGFGNFETVFRLLGEKGNGLAPEKRTELAHRAVNELAAGLEKSGEPAPLGAIFDRVHKAREKAVPLGMKSVDQALAALEARVDYLLLVQDLKEITSLGQKGQWDKAAVRAQARLLHPQLAAEVKQTLTEVVQLGREIQSADQLEAALKAAPPDQPAALASTLRPVHLEPLSSPLREQAQGLRSLTEIAAAAEGRWQSPPDTGRLKQHLADVQAVLGDPALATRLQQDLAVKLFLDGFPREARELLPDEGASGHAADLLHDLKDLMRGEGKVNTWPARRALSPAAGDRVPGRSALPPALRYLLPEGQWGQWRAPAAEPATSAETPVEVLARREKPVLDKARADLETERQTSRRRSADLRRQLEQFQQQIQQDEREDAVVCADLENQLQHPLAPAERLLAWHLRREGQKVPDIAAALRHASLMPPANGRSSSSPG